MDIPTFETNTDDILDENSDEDSLTDTELETDSDVVYNKNTETSSFRSSQCNEKQEKEVIHDQITGKTVNWPTIENQPLNEYTTPYLATMAFRTFS